MPPCPVLVVVVDGLRASALGAYGNTTYPTPALDQFAAESLLCDYCYAVAPELTAIYDSLWRSIHPASRDAARDAPALPAVLREATYESVLIADSEKVLSFAAAEEFSRRVRVAKTTTSARAFEVGETRLSKLFAAAADEVERSEKGPRNLVWVHSQGMYGPWDAPLDLQSALFEEGDPPPVESIEPPDLDVYQSREPEAAFRYGCAYAGQVMALDECWSAFLESIEFAGEEWLVILAGARGYPLGEHGRVGGVDSRLYAEQLHVPCLVRVPNGNGRLTRTSQLVSHVDVLPTIADHIQAPIPSGWQGASLLPLATSSRTAWRNELVSISGTGDITVRTPEWCWRQTTTAGSAEEGRPTSATAGELFVRPDDRWEANDVAKLCPDEVEALSKQAAQVSKASEKQSTPATEC